MRHSEFAKELVGTCTPQHTSQVALNLRRAAPHVPFPTRKGVTFPRKRNAKMFHVKHFRYPFGLITATSKRDVLQRARLLDCAATTIGRPLQVAEIKATQL
jgi:hypothetical protein